jgi:hypothetical protein
MDTQQSQRPNERTTSNPSPPVEGQPATPMPRRVQLPLGGAADFFSREQLTVIYRCTHGELGRLICRKMAPLPVRIDGVILWFADETLVMQPQVMRTLERWRRH